MKQRINNWTVQGYYPNVPMFGFSEEHGITQFSATDVYEVIEGDSIYDTLYKNGLIEPPMIDANSYKCEWVANRWWVYRASIEIKGESPRLTFEGVDGVFSVYFNNKFLARHANSYVPLTVDMSAFANTKGEITVMVENLTENLNQSGYTSKITAQRTRFDTKWDFCPRMVSLGIVAPVYLVTGVEVSEVKITANVNGEVLFDYVTEYATDGITVQLDVLGNMDKSNKAKGRLSVTVNSPELWNVNGRGYAKLYIGRLTVIQNGKAVWENEYNIGFRTVEFVANENAAENALPYTLTVNGERVYIKGVNVVPFDMSRVRITKERCEAILTKAKEMNVNFIRVWGGGTIESEDFYNCCDRLGILVWQDFMQSSSGIDNCATVIKQGLENIALTAESAVKRIRNHPSLAAYCGGNELMDNWVPLDFTHPNIAMLKEITDRLDGTRTMFPTTASGPNGSGNVANVGKGVHHDIHGPWTYDGNECHYEFYNSMDSLLHSEFGVDGFCNTETINKIFSEPQRELSEISKNYIWRHKAEWWDPMPVTQSIFGKADNTEEQIYMSQYIQAEGLRYAIEANRRRAFNNSGCIIWQFNEPYVNLCCTNLLDYFLMPKAAYFAVKQAYSAVNPSMKYTKTAYDAGEEFKAELFLTSDVSGEYDYILEIITDNGTELFNYKVSVGENGKSEKVGDISFTVPKQGAMRFNLTAISKDGRVYKNKVLLLIRVDGVCSKSEAIEFVKELKAQ